MNKIYIDTNCNLCNGYGKFLKKRNSNIILIKQDDLNLADYSKDELIYIRGNVKYYANEAIIESIYDLGSIYKFIKLFNLLPSSFSYFIYKIFAKNRIKLNLN